MGGHTTPTAIVTCRRTAYQPALLVSALWRQHSIWSGSHSVRIGRRCLTIIVRIVFPGILCSAHLGWASATCCGISWRVRGRTKRSCVLRCLEAPA